MKRNIDTPAELHGALDSDRKLPVRSHLAEVRKRLISCVVVVLVTTAISFTFTKYIFIILESRAENITLIYIEMTEMLGTYFRVAFVSGIVLAFPFLIYQFVMFIRPGLNTTEKRYLYVLLPSVMLAFAAGVAFGYFILIPPMTRFLITFGSDIATPQIRVGNFVSLIVRLLFALGLCFETPLLAFFLAKIGIVTPQMLSKYRKFAVVGAFILGAIITPTFDPINQSIVALPLIVLYEFGILLAKLARWKEKRQT